MAFDLGVDVLSLGAARQQLNQVDVVLGGAGIVDALPLVAHHPNEGIEGGFVIVEEEHVFPG